MSQDEGITHSSGRNSIKDDRSRSFGKESTMVGYGSLGDRINGERSGKAKSGGYRAINIGTEALSP